MIEEVGVIKAISATEVIVTTQMQRACQSCAQRSHCGTGALARALSDRQRDVPLPLPQAAMNGNGGATALRVGTEVKLGIAEKSLLQASLVMYLLPLLSLLLGGLLASIITPAIGLDSELWVIASSFGWFAMTFNCIRSWCRRRCRADFAPVLLPNRADQSPPGNGPLPRVNHRQ